MNIETFFNHWNLSENPFAAEEARDDQVYQRIMAEGVAHPEFEKLFGHPNQPSTAVVFGEKGSGKTALRLLMEDRIQAYNREHEKAKTWIVRYDEFNHMVDRVAGSKAEDDPAAFEKVRLEDHLDKIMSLIVTELIDVITRATASDASKSIIKLVRHMPRQQRLDLAYLAALFDQPSLSTPLQRWKKLIKVLRLRKCLTPTACMWISLTGLVAGAATYGAMFGMNFAPKWMLIPAAITPVLFAAGAWFGTAQAWSNRKRAKKITKEIHCVDHPSSILLHILGDFQQRDLASLPLPTSGDQDCRYELLGRMKRVLRSLHFVSLTVLVDRVDEPTRINGDARKMKNLIWPLFNHKFLQLDGLGIKMLLPIELGYELKREDADFYSRARLDKSNLIERLEWTGVTLFDICSKRLSSVYNGDGEAPGLNELFAEDVKNQELIEALDQMKQPRDAFKFFYDLLQQHCQNSTDEDPAFLIPKLTLDQTRRKQSQRVADLARGYSAS